MIEAIVFCLFAAVAEPSQVDAVEKTLLELDAETPAVTNTAATIEVEKAGDNKAGDEQEKSVKKDKKADKERKVKITSVRTDYDRREGVIMFDRNVFVDDPEYKLHADRVYVFLDGTNDLKRIVAIGNVAVTNELRSGTCAKATYSKASSKLVMYWDNETGKLARLEDNGKKHGELLGRKITFWTDTEQVEVEGSQITVDADGTDSASAAKKFLGK